MNRECFVIGGGASLEGFPFQKLYEKDTICVNKALFSVPNPTYFITTDYTFLSKLGKHRKQFIQTTAKKIFVVDTTGTSPVEQIHGDFVDTRFNLKYNLTQFDEVIQATGTSGFGYSLNDFRTGTNSGYCALQLAVALKYSPIYVLGIDLVNQFDKTHFHEGYGQFVNQFQQRLEKYWRFFESGLKQLVNDGKVQVFNCSLVSRLSSVILTIDVESIL
jgi:hypothetical protein